MLGGKLEVEKDQEEEELDVTSLRDGYKHVIKQSSKKKRHIQCGQHVCMYVCVLDQCICILQTSLDRFGPVHKGATALVVPITYGCLVLGQINI